MRWLRKATSARPRSTAAHDENVARLTARADLILEELDTVVKQMTEMLRDKASQQ